MPGRRPTFGELVAEQYRRGEEPQTTWRATTTATPTEPVWWVTENFQFDQHVPTPPRTAGGPLRTPKECNPATPKGEYEMDAD